MARRRKLTGKARRQRIAEVRAEIGRRIEARQSRETLSARLDRIERFLQATTHVDMVSGLFRRFESFR